MYCGRALVPPAPVPDPPASRWTNEPYVAPPASGGPALTLVGVAFAVLAVVGVAAFRGLQSRAEDPSSRPVPTAVAPVLRPEVPEVPVPPLLPVPRSSARSATSSGAAKGGAGVAAPAHPSVSVAVSRHDAAVAPAASLIGFVQPARSCFDKPKQRLTIELEFSAGGQLVSTSYARSEYDAPTAYVSARLDALRGSALSGYRTGQASRATLQMGS